MKILIVHDEYGNIRSAAIADERSDYCARLRVQRGEFVAEIEAQSVDLTEFRRHPHSFCERFRVDRISGKLSVKNR